MNAEMQIEKVSLESLDAICIEFVPDVGAVLHGPVALLYPPEKRVFLQELGGRLPQLARLDRGSGDVRMLLDPATWAAILAAAAEIVVENFLAELGKLLAQKFVEALFGKAVTEADIRKLIAAFVEQVRQVLKAELDAREIAQFRDLMKAYIKQIQDNQFKPDEGRFAAYDRIAQQILVPIERLESFGYVSAPIYCVAATTYIALLMDMHKINAGQMPKGHIAQRIEELRKVLESWIPPLAAAMRARVRVRIEKREMAEPRLPGDRPERPGRGGGGGNSPWEHADNLFAIEHVGQAELMGANTVWFMAWYDDEGEHCTSRWDYLRDPAKYEADVNRRANLVRDKYVTQALEATIVPAIALLNKLADAVKKP